MNRCLLCGATGHGLETCPHGPPDLGRTEFTDAQRAAREEDIERVRAGFFDKVRQTLGRVPFVPDAVALYHCMIDPRTPFWVRASVAGALLYFIAPIDAISDVVPVIGYTDDALVVYATLSLVHDAVTHEHVRAAREQLGLAPLPETAGPPGEGPPS